MHKMSLKFTANASNCLKTQWKCIKFFENPLQMHQIPLKFIAYTFGFEKGLNEINKPSQGMLPPIESPRETVKQDYSSKIFQVQ